MAGHLEDWYRQALGQSILTAESDQLAGTLSHLFGFHLLQLGCPNEINWLSKSPIGHHICLHPGPLLEGSVQGDMVAMPFAEDSIDVALLPHVLEFYPHPEAILAETFRVLLPEGVLLILGFNPWSLFGIKRNFCSRSESIPWHGKFISVSRLTQQLSELSFEVTQVKRFYHRPPLNDRGWLTRTVFMERLGRKFWPLCGGLYLLVAKKKVRGMTPLRSTKAKRPRVSIPAGIAEPTTRGTR